MKLIPLTKGYFAQVDDEDFDFLNQWKWRAGVRGSRVYAIRRGEDGKTVLMHRVILSVNDRKVDVDHKIGNGLDNTRGNIRWCTRSQNSMNKDKIRGLSSCYKGVCWDKGRNKWRVSVVINGVCKTVGRFEDEIEAAKAYDEKAKELYGEFARPNFSGID
jgi:hypothetical protein